MTEREQWRAAWTEAVAEGGVACGLVAGVLVYLDDENDRKGQARTFIADELTPAERDELLANMAKAIENARKQLAAGSN